MAWATSIATSSRAAKSIITPCTPALVFKSYEYWSSQVLSRQSGNARVSRTHSPSALWGFHLGHTRQQQFFHLHAPNTHKTSLNSNAQLVPMFGSHFETPHLNVYHTGSAKRSKPWLKIISFFYSQAVKKKTRNWTSGNDYHQNFLSTFDSNKGSILKSALVDCPKATLSNLPRWGEVSCCLDNLLQSEFHTPWFSRMCQIVWIGVDTSTWAWGSSSYTSIYRNIRCN